MWVGDPASSRMGYASGAYGGYLSDKRWRGWCIPAGGSNVDADLNI